MIGKVGTVPTGVSVGTVKRQRGFVWTLGSGTVVFVSAVLVAFARSYSLAGSIAIFVLIGAIVAASIRPIAGVYAIVFLTLIGDSDTAPWLLFSWNFSSRETSLYLSEKLFISPLEVLVVATTIFWLISDRPRGIVTGPVFRATALFVGFVAYGFVFGIGSGGDIRVALFEGRAMFLLLPIYMLIVNLFDAAALKRLMWTAVAASLVNALVALLYFDGLNSVERAGLEALGEHAAALQWNVILVLTIMLFFYSAGSIWLRVLMLTVCLPVMFVYVTAQRRAAVVGLVLAVGVVLLAMLWHRRGRFLVLAPILFIVLVGYVGVFWNSTSSAGFPAQAIKTIVASDQISEEDRGSGLYRQIENFDLNFTIRSAPLTGLGFGREFYRPIALPDISFFEFYRYIPHNTILWMWIKTGFLGFMSMFLMFAVAIRAGAQTFVTRAHTMNGLLALLGVTYVLMYIVFAFVDIAWDARSMVLLALSFALCSQHERDRPAWEEPAPEHESSNAGGIVRLGAGVN